MKSNCQVIKRWDRMWVLLFFLGFFLPLQGQQMRYPVQVNVALVPPYSIYLSDYASGSRERFWVTLLNRDVQYRSMPVKLRLTVKGAGFLLRTRPYASVPALTLEPDIPYKLGIDELQPYFDMRNLSAQGLGGESYLKGGRLPEGMIEFSVEVLEYHTSRLLSQQGTAVCWLTYYKPPQLSLPFADEEVAFRDSQNLLFQWTPQHTGVGRVEYELVIRELWDQAPAESSFAYAPEVYRERTVATSYLYGAQCPPLEPGRRYAWAVRVVARDGADDLNLFENDGWSVVRTFRVARDCPSPVEVVSVPDRGYVRLEWTGQPEHINYIVSYRLQGTEAWQETHSTASSAVLTGLRPGNTYEYRVGGYCDNGLPSYTSLEKIRLPLEDTSRQRNCGLQPSIDLSNQQPLGELFSGEQFMAGDFPIHVQEVDGGQGYFTGEGFVHIPYLAFAPFQVRFRNVYINSDRRLLRGVVETVYDPSESNVGNLNDIFTGGTDAGQVGEGIVQADVRSDFIIDAGNDFYYDAGHGVLEMRDEEGEVLGTIDLSTLQPGDSGMEGNTGGSIFPLTVEDAEGNLYEVSESPSDGGESGETKTPLVVKRVGNNSGSLDRNEVNLAKLDTVAEVRFTDTEGSVYAFDEWEEVYAGSYLIRDKYERLGKDYYVPFKLLPSGKPDQVGAVIRVFDASVDPEKVIFKTSTGTEFQYDSYDKSSGRYRLTLVGGKSNDGQELYALYPKPGGGYSTLGKLTLLSYPAYRLDVKVVPVGSDLEDFDALRRRMQEIYARVGIDCRVEKMPVFDYDTPLLFKEKTGMFSAYNDEMKQLNRAYEEQYGIDEKASYLFILSKSGQGRDRNYSGFMPLNKQFGYLFRDDFKRFDDFAVAAAHELAHGRLSLRHPFDKSLGLAEGDLPRNLMDYQSGTNLAKWQWDLIHDPGVVVRIFERDQDAAMQHQQDTMKRGIKIEMYNDKKLFEKGSYQLISALPAMPELSFKIPEDCGISGKVKFQLKVEYRRDNRNDEDYFPGKDKFEEMDVGSSWVVDWQNKIRGGKATLICHTTDNKDTLIFYIRGTNPTEQEIKNFLIQQSYSTDVWFLTRLIRQESQYCQFNPGTKYGSAWASSIGCPNWGTPHGWGLMQLDVLNSSCGELNKDGKYRPSAEALWNWKENLKVGYAFLRREKRGIANDRIKIYEKELEKWYEKNPTDSIAGYNNQMEGRITFMHASSPHFNFDWGILDSGLHSFMDAMWIKSYNGNSRGFYYELVVPDDEELKPYWQLNRLNSDNHNYVEAVGNQNE